MDIRRLVRAARKKKPAYSEGERRITTEGREDLSTLDIFYPLAPPHSFARIYYSDEEANLVYQVKEPVLSEKERKSLEKLEEIMLEVLDVDLFGIKGSDRAREYMRTKTMDLSKKYKIEFQQERMDRILYYIIRDFVGYGKIDPLMRDQNLEDIHCDGVGIPVYIVHMNYGSVKTNISFDDQEELNSFVVKLAQWSGRHVSVAEPLLDGSLPEGSRVQATYGSDVTMKGSTFTIRKFKEVPLTPIDLIKNGTVSPLILAYFWLAIENRASVLVSGGTATGKTTFLNVLSLFIKPETKIVSIEDTSELNLPHQHWVPTVARPGYGLPDISGKRYGEVTMFDLLRASLRQRPDYIVVGEVRGKEAYVLFQGMATGHPGLATIHSDSVNTLIQRLQTPPINLSSALLEALDIVTFLTHSRVKERPVRRVASVVEITGLSPEGEIDTREVFRWRPARDEFEFTGRSQVLTDLITTRGETSIWLSDSDVWAEIEKRKDMLEWMVKRDISGFREVSRVMSDFYRSPGKVLKRVYEEQH